MLGAAPLGQGCSLVEVGIDNRIDVQRCAAFEPGRTGRADVLAALGPPSALAPSGDGVAMLWEHVSLEERQFGLSLQEARKLVSRALGLPTGVAGFSLVKITLGRSGSSRDAVLLYFDRAGLLEARSLSHWTQVMGKGGAAQFVVTVESVVDSDAFLESPRTLTWGRELLEPLPSTLNLAHDPALELRATPTRAGQRALEYAPFSQDRRD